ncbi:MAG: aminotransferase class V-fold PLP-dependent enzyme [Actinomycetota bacterium]|nr:MAG: aminotransferase class V-fold PLP-dependent enzyme [Actinomycetota bacterium]
MADLKIFFDNASTTRVDPEVLEDMLPYFSQHYGNPSSLHDFGDTAHDALDNARSQVAALIGASEEEIYFTSCGTESNNLALWGLGRAAKRKGKHIISSVIEHQSIINPLKDMKKEGWEITRIGVDSEGIVDPGKVQKAINGNTVLISIMHANNEVGTIQRIKKISDIARQKEILFHSDGMATAGIIPVDVNELGVDAYSFSAHQLYGPKGAAALYLRKGIRIKPLLLGGIQERGRRAGTENIPAIVGFGKACKIAKDGMGKNMTHITDIRDRLIEGIFKSIDKTKLNGHPTRRIPGSAHISFEFIEGESILLMLNMEGIFAASGSSCASQALKSSYVLTEMGLSPTMAQGSISFSLGKYNTIAEVDRTLEVLPPIIERLRKMSPLFKE